MRILKRLRALQARLRPKKSYDEEIAHIFEILPKDADGNVLPLKTDEEYRLYTRLKVMMAGLPPVDSTRELSMEDLHRVLEFHNDDQRGERLELPDRCFSWRMDPDVLRKCEFLWQSRNRGEVTPEEYQRHIHELCGVPLEKTSSRGG